MTFGEKLFKLRKEKGFSQEALAERLGTTRQAISKWENGQGYPETEKLLMIGNLFEVSLDYLLKDTVDQKKEDEEGYYVSREMAEGFLLSARKCGWHVSLGFGLFALAFEPYFIFQQHSAIALFLMIMIATLGVAAFVSAGFDEGRYTVLKKKVLLLDPNFLKELNERYEEMKKRYSVVMVIGGCLLTMGFLPFALEKKFAYDALVPYAPIFVGFIAIGFYILLRLLPISSAYLLLVKNEERVDKLGFKLKRKLRKKVDDIL